MMTAALAVKNILGANHDLWQVNTDRQYQEEGRSVEAEGDEQLQAELAAGQPTVPERIQAGVPIPAIEYEG